MNITININRRSAIAIACIAMVCAVTSASALDAVAPKVPTPAVVPPVQPPQPNTVVPSPQVSTPVVAPAQSVPTETGLKAKPLTTRSKPSQGLAAGEGRVLFPYGQSQPTITLNRCQFSTTASESFSILNHCI